MARTGRPPLFLDVAAFEKQLNHYKGGFFQWCKDKKHLPLVEWFAVYMGCSADAIRDYIKKDGIMPDGSYDEQQDFSLPIKRIAEEMNAFLVEYGLTTKLKHDALIIFCLKQRGYTDKQEIDNNMTVTVQIAGDENGLAD